MEASKGILLGLDKERKEKWFYGGIEVEVLNLELERCWGFVLRENDGEVAKSFEKENKLRVVQMW